MVGTFLYRCNFHPDPFVFVEQFAIEAHIFLASIDHIMFSNELDHWRIKALERNIFFYKCINANLFQIQVTLKALAKIINVQPVFAEHI